MEKLLNALHLDSDQYDDLITKQWFDWCGRNTRTLEELQSLMANSSLFDWWRMEYAQFERDFLFEVAPYKGNTTRNDALMLYIKNVHKMQLYYSKPLIAAALKANIQ